MTITRDNFTPDQIEKMKKNPENPDFMREQTNYFCLIDGIFEQLECNHMSLIKNERSINIDIYEYYIKYKHLSRLE